MTATTAELGTILAELLALAPDGRLASLRATGPPEALLLTLADETERLAAVEVAQAVAAAEMVVALADEIGAPLARANARGAQAMTLAYANRFADALAVCDAGIAIAEAAGLVVEAARVRLASVHALSRLARYDEALEAGEAARAALVAAGEPALAARADVSIGATHDERDEPRLALAHYDRARDALAADPIALAQLETNRGTALMALDEFAAAEAAFGVAVAVFAASGLDWAVAVAEGNLAYLATRQGRLERALHHFERARRCLEQDDAPADLARLLAEEADAFGLMGLSADAVATFDRVLPDLEAHGLAAEAAHAHAGRGRALMRLRRLEEADGALARAADAFDVLDLTTARARVDLTRAEVAAARGRSDESQSLLRGALEVLRDRPVEAVAAHYGLARLALASGDLTSAETELAAALPAAEALDLAPVLADLFHLRGLVHRAAGRPDRALIDLRAAVTQVERVRGTLQAERFRAAYLGNRLATYEAFVRQALDRRDAAAVDDAFAVVERAKSRALLDRVGGALDLVDVAAHDADPAEADLLHELSRLRAELNWLYSRLDNDGNGTRAAATTNDWPRAVHEHESALEALQDRIAVGRGVAGLYATPLDLSAALRLVPPDAALVEYFVAGDELVAFVLRDGRARVVRGLASDADVVDCARRFHFQIGRAVHAGAGAVAGPRTERLLIDVRRELGALYDVVLGPVLPAIGDARRLIVVPHGPLHTIPFHALWDGERHVIETFDVQYTPSASLLGHLAAVEDRAAPAGGALVVGVPDALAPRIGAEAERVAQTLGVGWLLLGADATAARVVAAARTADVVHLACHGRFSAESPLASGLKLADRWLTVRDVYALRLRASLVTLSGCDTGRAVVGGGDELVGLMRGFFAAGAASLLISLWTVNDESTAHLMTTFYDAWRRGATKTAALRTAQRAIWRHDRTRLLGTVYSGRNAMNALIHAGLRLLIVLGLFFSTALVVAPATIAQDDDDVCETVVDDDGDFSIDGFCEGQAIVRLQPGASIQFFNERHGTRQLAAIASRNVYLLQLPQSPPGSGEYDEATQVAELRADSKAQWAELNYLDQAPEGRPQRFYLRGYEIPTVPTNPYAPTLLGVPRANTCATGQGVTVAVIDSGIDAAHPVFAGRLVPGRNVLPDLGTHQFADVGNGNDDDGDGRIDEMTGHGTHVAGIVVQTAPQAKILPIRALDSDGIGNAFFLAVAIYHAIDRGVDVVNLSLGSTHNAIVTRDAIADAVSGGIFVAAAAGNENRQAPGNIRGSAPPGVTSTNANDRKSDFSNFHPNVDLSAPGTAINSAFPNNRHRTWSGTSMATPWVSERGGAPARQAPKLGRLASAQSTDVDRETALSDQPDLQQPPRLGAGRLDVGAAVACGAGP